MPSLAAFPCQGRCDWGPTGEHRGTLRLFRCSTCRSEWTKDQAWRPADEGGWVANSVLTELAADSH